MHRCIELFVPLLILLLQLEVDVCIAGITTEHVDQLQGAPVIVDLDNRTIDEEFPSSRGDEEYEASGDDPGLNRETLILAGIPLSFTFCTLF